jgi:rhodanese-related sulfurtransferase
MEPSRIRAVGLLDRIEHGEKTVLIDARNPNAWAESDQKLPGALRIPADEIELHTHKLPCDQLIVTYCSCRKRRQVPVRHKS